jgi:hypothetical protein
MHRRNFLKLSSAGAVTRAIPGSVVFVAAQATAIRLAVMARALPLASRAWYAIVDEAIQLSASFPKTEGALFKLFMKISGR